jgi:hypothetical protein
MIWLEDLPCGDNVGPRVRLIWLVLYLVFVKMIAI